MVGKPELAEVVVKVQRPDIDKLIRTDLEALANRREVAATLQTDPPAR